MYIRSLGFIVCCLTTPPSVMLQCILQIIKLLFCWKAVALAMRNGKYCQCFRFHQCPWKEICWWLLKRVQTVWIQMSEPWDLSWICVQSFHNGPTCQKYPHLAISQQIQFLLLKTWVFRWDSFMLRACLDVLFYKNWNCLLQSFSNKETHESSFPTAKQCDGERLSSILLSVGLVQMIIGSNLTKVTKERVWTWGSAYDRINTGCKGPCG